jgi:benzoate-CoA ligase
MHRHQDVLVMNEHYGKQVLGLLATDVFASPSKMHFAYGLNSLLFALYWGATVQVFAHRPTAQELWDLLATEVTVFFGVPRVYQALLEQREQPNELSCRLCISAGDKLPASIQRQWWQQFDQPILDGIGTTEVLSTFISNWPGHWRYGSTGWPVPGFEVQLVTPNGEQASSNQPAILWVRGDTYPTGYVNNQQASAERFQHGWFNTNDVFYRDQEGWWYYQGRWGDMVYYRGSWLSPYKLEEALVEHPVVNNAAVVSVNNDWQCKIIAWIVVNNGELLTDDLRRQLCYQLSDWIDIQPENVRSVEAMPATPAGKKKRFLLKNKASMYISEP